MSTELIARFAERAGVAYAHNGELLPSHREDSDMTAALNMMAALVAEHCANERLLLPVVTSFLTPAERDAYAQGMQHWQEAVRAAFPMPKG